MSLASCVINHVWAADGDKLLNHGKEIDWFKFTVKLKFY